MPFLVLEILPQLDYETLARTVHLWIFMHVVLEERDVWTS